MALEVSRFTTGSSPFRTSQDTLALGASPWPMLDPTLNIEEHEGLMESNGVVFARSIGCGGGATPS